MTPLIAAFRRRPYLWIVVLSLALRAAMLVYMPPYPLQDDTRVYLGIAQNVVKGWGFSIDNDGDGIPEMSSREPGYPLFLAGLLSLGVSSAVETAKVIQVVLNGLTAFGVYGLAVHLFSTRTAVIAALLYAIHPGLIVESTIPGHEGLAIPLLVFGLWGVMKGRTTDQLGWFALAGILFGIGALVKQTLIVVPVLVAVAAIADDIRWGRRFVRSGLMLVLVCVTVGPWVIRTIVVRNELQRLIAQVMAEQKDATRSEMQSKGLELHHRVLKPLIRSGQAVPDAQVTLAPVAPPSEQPGNTAQAVPDAQVTPASVAPRKEQPGSTAGEARDLTLLARATYELYEGDPRRSLPVLSGSGGDVEVLLSRPFQFARRVLRNATSERVIRDVFLVPYENRYVELLYPQTPRLSEWMSRGATLDRGSVFKLVFTATLMLVHVGAILGLFMSLRNRAAWPVVLTLLYFYAVPFVHTAPLNRFVFLATPLMLCCTAVALSQPVWLRGFRSRNAASEVPTARACA